MREDVIKAKVIALMIRVEKELPDVDDLHAAARRLRTLLEKAGNREAHS